MCLSDSVCVYQFKRIPYAISHLIAEISFKFTMKNYIAKLAMWVERERERERERAPVAHMSHEINLTKNMYFFFPE